MILNTADFNKIIRELSKYSKVTNDQDSPYLLIYVNVDGIVGIEIGTDSYGKVSNGTDINSILKDYDEFLQDTISDETADEFADKLDIDNFTLDERIKILDFVSNVLRGKDSGGTDQ